MEKLIFIFLLGIIILLVMICYTLIDLHNDLKKINATIIDIHPGYKYKKVYQSQRYEKDIKSY